MRVNASDGERQEFGSNPVAAILLGFLGFLVGFVSIQVGATHTVRSRAFAATPGFRIWSLTIGAQTAFWAVVAFPLWKQLREYRVEWRRRRLMVVVSGAAMLVLLAAGPVVYRWHIDWPLWDQSPKIAALTAVGAIVIAIPAACGILLVQFRVQANIGDIPAAPSIEKIATARNDIRRFLVIAGSVVGLATLATGALRNAVVPTFVPASLFPGAIVLVYGAFLTGLLAGVYVPAQLRVTDVARRIRDSALSPETMPDPASNAFLDWLEKRKAVEELLHLDSTPGQDLQASLFILAPLLSGIFSVLLPHA